MRGVPLPLLADRLRELVRRAAAGGAEAAWLERTAGELVDALLELEDCRAGSLSSTAHEIRQAERAWRDMERAGVPARERAARLRARFGWSRSKAYRRLEAARMSQRAETFGT